MKKILLLACVVLLVGCQALPDCTTPSVKQVKFSLMLSEKVPKGIKTKTRLMYNLGERSGVYKKILIDKEVHKYDDRGNEIEWTQYGYYDKLSWKDVFKYDDKGNQIEKAQYDANGKLLSKYVSIYDNKGNQIEYLSYDADSKVTAKGIYKHDDKDNQIEYTAHDADGKMKGKYTRKYDDKGNQIEHASYDAEDKVMENGTYKYDDKGNQIEHVSYDADRKVKGRQTYKYGDKDKGKPIEYIWYGADGKVNGKNIYKYDNRGNLIENVAYNAYLKETVKVIYKYNDKDCLIEQFGYNIKEVSGKVQEIPINQFFWEYELYSDIDKPARRITEDQAVSIARKQLQSESFAKEIDTNRITTYCETYGPKEVGITCWFIDFARRGTGEITPGKWARGYVVVVHPDTGIIIEATGYKR